MKRSIDFRGLFILVSILFVGACYELYILNRDIHELAEASEKLIDEVSEDWDSFLDVTAEGDTYEWYMDIVEHYNN